MSDELKAELKAKLEAKGVEVPHQWGVPKMESVLAEMAISDDHVPEETELVPDPDPELEGDETVVEADPDLDIPHPGAPKEPEPAPEQPDGTLRCRVTKKGHHKIFTGKDDPKYFDWEEEIYLPPKSARQLEDRAFVEILDEPID